MFLDDLSQELVSVYSHIYDLIETVYLRNCVFFDISRVSIKFCADGNTANDTDILWLFNFHVIVSISR